MGAPEFPVFPLTEVLPRLAEMPSVLANAIAGRSDAALRTRTEAGGDFSLVEHACHLRDLEREGYLVRLARVLAEENPELPGFEGGVIAKQRNYPEQDAHAAARDFALARAELIAGFAALHPVQLGRLARFGGRTITLSELASMVVDHDREHREEIARLLATLPG